MPYFAKHHQATHHRHQKTTVKAKDLNNTRFDLYCNIMNTVSPHHKTYIQWLIRQATTPTSYITPESCEVYIREVLLMYDDDSLVAEYDYVCEWTYDNL